MWTENRVHKVHNCPLWTYTDTDTEKSLRTPLPPKRLQSVIRIVYDRGRRPTTLGKNAVTNTDHTPEPIFEHPTMEWYHWLRGTGWIFLAIFGGILIGPHLAELGIPEYTQRWLGACFKAASGAWIGFRISRGTLRIDPGSTTEPVGFALLHVARAIVVAAVIFAICSAT